MATYLIGNVKGPKGEDGYSPRASVQQTSNGAVITVEDQSGITSAFVRDGVDADGNNIDLTVYATKVELQNEIDDLADTYATKTELEDIDIGVISVNNMTGDVIIPPTDLTGYATEAWIQQQGYMTEAPVTTVNNKTGTVVLDAEDVGALPDDTVIPTKVSDLTNDSNFVSSATLNSLLQGKQDTLTAGNNITITNNVISADGGFSGDYDDLTNKPDLSVYAESADLATVATTGDYDDLTNKPTIPTVPTDVSAFTNDAGYITSADLPADELPAITTGDAGKVLTVNSGETGVEWAEASGGGASYTAGNNVTIDSNNVISVDGLSLTENSQSIQGATNTTIVSGGKVDILVEAAGNELGSISLDAERGGMFGESAIYNKKVSLGMTGLQFNDTANSKIVTLAPNANYDGFTINGVDIPMSSGGSGTTYTAGNGVDITNDEINVLADGTTIGFNANNQLAVVASYTPTAVYQAGIASKQDKLRAGSNISISDSNVISAVDTRYSSGDGIVIDNNKISVDTNTVVTHEMIEDHDGTNYYQSAMLNFDGLNADQLNADGDYVNGAWLNQSEIGIDHATYSQDEQDWITDSSTIIAPNAITLGDEDGEAIISKHRGIDLMVSDGGSNTKTIAYVEDVLPTEPSTNGTYFLTATVSSGTVTKAWASIPAANGNNF